MTHARIMFEMTVQEVRDGLRETQTIIVPIGITEQHGYHLPLSTDIFNAQELAARTSAVTGCFVAPTVPYNFSGGMLPGTINISPQVFSLLLMDICQSLVTQGFKHIILLLGHGGTESVRAVNDAAENFQRLRPQLGGITISVVPFWEFSPTYMQAFEDRDFHSGRYETSLMLFWHPELVKMEKAQLDSPAMMKRMYEDQDAYLVKTKLVEHPYVIPKITPHPEIEVGVMGNYAGASAEFGQQMAEECVAGLVKMIATLTAKSEPL